MMEKSLSIIEIAKALHLAQGEMSGAKKGAANPFFKSKYADLNSVVDAIREPFCNHGLSYSQFPIYEDGFAGVTTILMHVSGEWLQDSLMLPVVKKDPQAVGSAITYARRYALQSIAGIPSEDDDGNAASQPAKSTKAVSDPNMDLISEAIKNNDSDFVKQNWTGLIANCWPKLSAAQSEALNTLFTI